MRSLFFVSALLVFASPGLSVTTYVPDQYATIQLAIDASQPNDTIIVRPGRYHENIDFKQKVVTVVSEQGPALTIIDGDYKKWCVAFQKNETAATVLDGFTITNGTGTAGGGILCDGASPTIRNNVITGNFVSQLGIFTYGGAIYCVKKAAPTISGNVITENGSSWYGGGICSADSSPIITGNTITNNWAMYHGGGIACIDESMAKITGNIISDNVTTYGYSYGGGIYCDASSPEVSGNTIVDNESPFSGGGVCCFTGGSPTLTGNTIRSNRALRGAGIACISSAPVVEENVIADNSAPNGGIGGAFFGLNSSAVLLRNLICGNTAAGDGGAFFFYIGEPVLTGNAIGGNSAARYGGAMVLTGCAADIKSNTIYGNTAGACGGAIYSFFASPVITNSILWDNDSPSGNEIWFGDDYYGDALVVSYSDIQGGEQSIYLALGCTLDWGDGMISADPLLAEPAVDDFHLTRHSPCCNAGDNTAVSEDADFEGDARVEEDVVDIGADEYYFHLYHSGVVTAGSIITLRIVGGPGMPIILAHSDTIQDPPETTPWGDLYIAQPPLWNAKIGYIPYVGIAKFTMTVPLDWEPGELKYFQALVGSPGGPQTTLTNLETLTVE